MKRCNLYLSEETIRYLDEIKEANGASRSGSVTVAVKQYHGKLTDESAEFIKALKPGQKLGSKNKPKEIVKGDK